LKTAERYKCGCSNNRVCICKIIFKLFYRRIQTRLPLTTAFVCLLLGLRQNSPLACPLFRLRLCCLRVPSSSSSSAFSSCPSHCPRIASPSPSPFNQPLFRLSLSLSAVSLLRPPPPRGGSFAATTTTTQTLPPRLSLSDIFFFYRRDAHHHWRLSLSLALSNFFFCLTWFYIFRSLPLLCRLFSTIVEHTLPLSLIFRFVHSIFLFN